MWHFSGLYFGHCGCFFFMALFRGPLDRARCRLSPHISRYEICAASKFLLSNNLARPTGPNGKTKVVFPSADGVNSDRPDQIKPYRPVGRIFHAGMKYPG
jgi:hypothetical protein